MTTQTARHFGTLSAVIGSAAVVATSIFALFNSVLKDLMPQIPRAGQAVGFASFGTTVVLLVLVLMIRERLSVVSQYLVASIALALLVAAAISYFFFSSYAYDHVYYYPPTVAAGEQRQPYINAPYHPTGAKLAQHMDTATAVHTFGGPELVNGHELLWTQESLNSVYDKFVRLYVLIAFLMTASLLTAAIAVWRVFDIKASDAKPKRQATKRPPRVKKDSAS